MLLLVGKALRILFLNSAHWGFEDWAYWVLGEIWWRPAFRTLLLVELHLCELQILTLLHEVRKELLRRWPSYASRWEVQSLVTHLSGLPGVRLDTKICRACVQIVLKEIEVLLWIKLNVFHVLSLQWKEFAVLWERLYMFIVREAKHSPAHLWGVLLWSIKNQKLATEFSDSSKSVFFSSEMQWMTEVSDRKRLTLVLE